MVYNDIFHIDDDLDDCLIFNDAIIDVSNAHYSWENNPITALEQLISGAICPQLIFLDLNMPLIDGREFLSQMIKHKILSSIPVIVFSTMLPCNNAALDFSNIIGQYTKPTDYGVLKSIMQKVINGI